MKAGDMSSHRVRIARVYDDPTPEDGTRVLVDRLWPRGLRKDEAVIDIWLKDVAPSTALRQWYGHDPAKHAVFVKRYRVELHDSEHAAALASLTSLASAGPLTLLTATKDLGLSQAAVLATELS